MHGVPLGRLRRARQLFYKLDVIFRGPQVAVGEQGTLVVQFSDFVIFRKNKIFRYIIRMPYIRKYAGPLQPGKRSAYVKGGRRNAMRRPYAAKKIQRAFRKRRYKPSAAFTKQMNKYNNINCEKKIMLMNNYLNGPTAQGYLQDIDGVGLNNAGLINNALTCVVLQTGRQLTDENTVLPTGCVKLMDGYSCLNGTLPGRLIGQYAKITSSYINLNITMDPQVSTSSSASLDASLPHQFRLIQVKAKRANMVNPGLQVASVGVPSIATNLFRNEEGLSRGINDSVATQDIFTWFINKQFWTVLKDERFTLTAPNLFQGDTETRYIAPNVSTNKATRFKKYWLPKPKNKVIFRSNTVDGVARNEIVDYNYVVHTIILCKNTSAGERASNHWSVQANGATAFIDE